MTRRAYAPERPAVKRLALTDLLATQPDAVNRCLRKLDPDPRIPAVVKAPAPAAIRQPSSADKITIFVPLRYSTDWPPGEAFGPGDAEADGESTLRARVDI